MAKSTRDEPGVSARGLLVGSLVVRLTLTTSVLIVATCIVLSMVLVSEEVDMADEEGSGSCLPNPCIF